MGKISLKPYNDYCPQTLFLYGTYDENGNPDFGLFCWFSYIWDGEMGVMCCIGGDKTTVRNIKRNKIFSANLVTEELLNVADYMGIVSGNNPDKMKIGLDIGKGEVLDVPTGSFGGIGVFAIPEMGRFYRHVLVQKGYPHHGAVAFAHVGKYLFETFKFLGVKDIAYNQPKSLPYPTENPFA